jgi:hypothetical protein
MYIEINNVMEFMFNCEKNQIFIKRVFCYSQKKHLLNHQQVLSTYYEKTYLSFTSSKSTSVTSSCGFPACSFS